MCFVSEWFQAVFFSCRDIIKTDQSNQNSGVEYNSY